MANLMDSVRLKNKPSRNGFDLSFKNNFTSKAGELLPIMCKPVLPADTFKVNLKSFTRLQPVNTAAFVRMREYYDFYFVPMENLWNRWDSVITQMRNNLQHATSLLATNNVTPSGSLPYVTCEQVANVVHLLKWDTDLKRGGNHQNIFGFDRADLVVKLLQYLGYPDFSPYLQETVTWSSRPMPYNLELSVLPLLAYQKIYSDHFRNTQWERTSPSCFNIDYIKGVDDLQLNITDTKFIELLNFFDLRYANYNKDLFFGVMPNAQYGDESSVSVMGSNDATFITRARLFNGGGIPEAGNIMTDVFGNVVDEKTQNGLNLISSISGKFSILALRQAEAFQRWKEVSQSVSEDYKQQIESHFGIKVSQYLSHESRYLGGIASSLDINPVVNNNITGNNSANIAGLGTVANNGMIEFESKGEYGYIICIYHAVPIFDYACAGVDSVVTDTDVLDFPIPEFDRIGMEQLPSYLLSNPSYNPNASLGSEGSQTDCGLFVKSTPFLGYVPRYACWKTSVDVANGAFRDSLKSWVMPFNFDVLSNFAENGLVRINTVYDGTENTNSIGIDGVMNWVFFKCNPKVMDTIFAVGADSSVNTDTMLTSCYLDIKVVRNLDYNGLPY